MFHVHIQQKWCACDKHTLFAGFGVVMNTLTKYFLVFQSLGYPSIRPKPEGSQLVSDNPSGSLSVPNLMTDG